jgi:type II secretory pathway predicted ATPase ExeA
MTLIERSVELTTLEASLCDKGRVVLIHGPVASGKTALLQEFADRGLTDETFFLHAMASRTEHTLRFGVMRQLFSHVPASEVSDDNAVRMLSESPPSAGKEPRAHGRVAARTLDALWTELLNLSRRRPLLLVVDDVHYVDDPSLDCLLYFARRLKTAPIVMVLADCTRPQQANWLFRAELMRQRHCIGIHLRLLSQRGVERLLTEHLGADVADSIAAAAHQGSGDNPLLVRALIDDQRGAVSKTPGELAIGEAFSHAVQSCLNRSDPAMLHVALGLAVLDAPAPPAVLGQLLDIPAESAAGIAPGRPGGGSRPHVPRRTRPHAQPRRPDPAS